jgi:hypothetical protein
VHPGLQLSRHRNKPLISIQQALAFDEAIDTRYMEYLAIIFFAVVTCVTPGPNNTMIMTSGLNYGVKRSLPHFLGIVLGFRSWSWRLDSGWQLRLSNIPCSTPC